jgi:hypothetical protein
VPQPADGVPDLPLLFCKESDVTDRFSCRYKFILVPMLGFLFFAIPSHAQAYLSTKPAGSRLPSGSACASLVKRGPAVEIRPENRQANNSRGFRGIRIAAASPAYNAANAGRVDGNFTGTTEQILRWGACKWGFDENLTRARAVVESWWYQRTKGDRNTNPVVCRRIGKAAPCFETYGLLQVRGTVHPGTYPHSERSTAFSVDYSNAWLRACYEGAFSKWMGHGYRKGDLWGCVGAYFSGRWYDPGAQRYIARIRQEVALQRWKQRNF